jgi:glutathione synthase/RimK-type ligase-like ATP-grasp enzyme
MTLEKPRIAILYDPESQFSPSNQGAISKFELASKNCDLNSVVLKPKDNHFSCIERFDALFIRCTTTPNNFTYAWAREAERLQKYCIDDLDSITLGCDKVTQNSLFRIYNIPTPETFVINAENFAECHIPYPRVVKKPDGCFSRGLTLAKNVSEYNGICAVHFQKVKELVVQEFVHTDFDWRIGILNKQVLFTCKYFMPDDDWRIVKYDRNGNYTEGKSECVTIYDVPQCVLTLAGDVTQFLGRGLYGLDIKQIAADQAVIIEINDNPSIDSGCEDEVEGQNLYDHIIWNFSFNIRDRLFKNFENFS